MKHMNEPTRIIYLVSKNITPSSKENKNVVGFSFGEIICLTLDEYNSTI